MIVVGVICFVICYAIMVYFILGPSDNSNVHYSMNEVAFLIVFGFFVIGGLLAGIYMECYSLLGCYFLYADKITIVAPLRKRITLYYNEIKSIGIDYSVINGQPQFWVYMSKGEIPKKYWNSITKLPFTSETIRVQYSQNLFDSLIHMLPKKVAKELQKADTVIQRVQNPNK